MCVLTWNWSWARLGAAAAAARVRSQLGLAIQRQNSATFGDLSDRHGLGSYPRVLPSCTMACALMVMSGGGRTPQLEPLAGDSAAPVGQTARLKCTYDHSKTNDASVRAEHAACRGVA